MIKFGSARIDERGNAANGAAGDQTGKEVMLEPFYMHPLGWKCYRPKDVTTAHALAAAMIEACSNSHIGYDQNQRTGVIAQLAKYKTLGAIATNTEADCSSLVRACCIQAGFDPGNFTTYNEGKALEATGRFEPPFTVTGEGQLYNGDVLITSRRGHTGIICTGRDRAPAKTLDQIAEEVIAGKWGTGTARKKALEAAGYNYSEVQKLVNAKLKGGPSKTPKWVGFVNTGLLNVRSEPKVSNPPGANVITQLGYKNMVDVCDQSGSWYYIRFKWNGRQNFGYVAANYITKA